ncbi:hypothetical protein [Caloramator sp. ALD01]|nr:hypothetical protein [Caloramator sp. ALD01]
MRQAYSGDLLAQKREGVIRMKRFLPAILALLTLVLAGGSHFNWR